jgi:DNA-binding transcriptional ArsR family regulator
MPPPIRLVAKLKGLFDKVSILSNEGYSKDVQATLSALSNPQRREILRLVWDGELSSRDIASNFDVTWQAVSHNLRVLKEAGLVAERREGTRRLYRADPEKLGPLETLLRDFWRQDLERLERVIESDKSEEETP